MQKRRISTHISSLAVAFTILLGSVALPSASAATTPSAGGNGYKISPVRTDVVIAPGKSQTIPVYVQNVSNAVENLQVVVNDFQARGDESGNPAILLNGSAAPQHGLKQYTTVPLATLSLQPGEQKQVNAVIAIPADAAAGGYYGAIRIAPVSQGTKNTVTLAASVASLVLVKVPGVTKEQVSIASFGVSRGAGTSTVFTSGKSLQAVVRFQNSGNIQEEPFGKILVKKGSSQTSYELNNTDPRGNVLPDSIRKFTVPIKAGSFGKYTVQGNFGYGNNGQLLTASTTFYVIPVAGTVAVVVAIFLLAFAAFGLPRMIRRYNHRVLRKAGRI